MKFTARSFALTFSLTAFTALAACSGHAPHPQAPTAIASASGEIDSILALLMQGDTKTARSRLKTLLKRDPMNASALVLRESIDSDARAALGPDSYSYTVRAGDTMVDLSQRFLGNRLKAYQLARYNGITDPSTLAAGQVLQIPGEAPHAATSRPASEPEHNHLQPPAERPKPAVAPVESSAPAGNPAAARQARSAGLAALAQGNVARAVAMLRRAHALDPSSPLIARDLARAERIASTVRARR